MPVRNNLITILESKGIRQTWLAEKAGVDKSTIGNIIKNRFGTNVEAAIKIAKALDLRVEDIWEVID